MITIKTEGQQKIKEKVQKEICLKRITCFKHLINEIMKLNLHLNPKLNIGICIYRIVL